MGIIKKARKQKAVYWALASAAGGEYDYTPDGQPRYTSAVQIDCRWDDVNEEFIDAQGTKHISKSEVMVDRDVDLGGVLWLGLLADCQKLVPFNNAGASEILRFDNIPNLKATEFLKIAYL